MIENVVTLKCLLKLRVGKVKSFFTIKFFIENKQCNHVKVNQNVKVSWRTDKQL